MKRLSFKRHLILLVTCLLAIGVIVPVATFAKSASGEPHRSLIPSERTQHMVASTGLIASDVTTDAPCSSPTTVNPSPFSADEKVTVTASLADVNDPSENTENEPLLVFDTGGVFKQTIIVDTGSQTFPAFTATASDTLEACITGDGADGDELGTINFTVTTPPRRQLIIFLQGIDTTLMGKDITNQITPKTTGSTIAKSDIVGLQTVPSTVRKVFPNASTLPGSSSWFLEYSYFGSRTDNGIPVGYNCVDTFSNPLLTDIKLLNKQINNALKAEPAGAQVDIYLIGHSLGGSSHLDILTSLKHLMFSMRPSHKRQLCHRMPI